MKAVRLFSINKDKGKKNNKIRAILFDMVGVLLFKKKGYSPKTKEELNAEEIEKLYNNVDDKKLLADIKNKLGLSDEEIKKALTRIPEKYEKFEGLWSLLPVLEKKYKLALINNGNSLAEKYWRKKFDFSIFDEFIASAKIGIKKSDPRIYLLTCKKLKVKPENCLFLDDLKENIAAAKKLKMKTLWCKSKKSFLNYFEK
jgi:epoxide hydrolase-like predicted phosphatase